MKTTILPRILITLLAAGLFQPVFSQQWVVDKKDQTRPDPNAETGSATYGSISARPNDGYNDIMFSPSGNTTSSSYVVEYSIDGVQFQRAGEVVATNGNAYSLKHYTPSRQPLLYRVGTRDQYGRLTYSKNFMVDGTPAVPVRIIPNTVTQDVLNVNSAWPLYRVGVFSLDGTQLLARDLNGQRDFIPVALPRLSKGMYVVRFVGDGWQHSEKILVP